MNLGFLIFGFCSVRFIQIEIINSGFCYHVSISAPLNTITDQQLKEQQAQLIMEQHEREDKEETHRQLQQEVDNLKRKHQLIIDENNLLSIKVNQHCHLHERQF